MALLGMGYAWAVPAFPGQMTIQQADGTTITVMMRGDEHGSCLFTTDGYPLTFNEASGFYEYATVVQGVLRPSGFVATETADRPKEVRKMLASLDRDALQSAANQLIMGAENPMRRTQSSHHKLRGMNKVRISDIPTTGKQKALVILAEFSDCSFSTMEDPKSHYNDLLNARNYTNNNGATGSAWDFYNASSNGLYDPEFVVVGPVKLSKSYVYYGQPQANSYSGDGENLFDFCADVAKAADDLVDFSEFDSDNDGKVDNIYIFYAGYGEADTGSRNYIWPHSAEIEEFGMSLKLDGVQINRYACSQEINGQDKKAVGIGTFVHEYGHVLGLADHYNTQNSYDSGTGSYDTMAGGSYNNNQNTPPLFSSFEQAELGWLDYTPLTTDADSLITILPMTQKLWAIAWMCLTIRMSISSSKTASTRVGTLIFPDTACWCGT